jgi:hypothetical protein
MATTYSRRCALCGQLQITEDREALLEQERFEWDGSLVDDFIAGNRHLRFDTDPHGARESERLIGAGVIGAELRWLLEVAPERKQAAPVAAWAVFTTTSTMVPSAQPAMACRRVASGTVRGDLGARAHDCLLAGGIGRSPPCAVVSVGCITTTVVAERPVTCLLHV